MDDIFDIKKINEELEKSIQELSGHLNNLKTGFENGCKDLENNCNQAVKFIFDPFIE